MSAGEARQGGAVVDGLYHVPDEPRPSALAHLTVNPFWPLLAFMVGGAFIAWPWSVFNAFAFGSPNRWRCLAVGVGGFVGSAGLVATVLTAASAGLLDTRLAVRLALVGVVGFKILVSYSLHELQAAGFELHEWFGGKVRNGGIVVLVAFFAASRVADLVPPIVWLVVR